jgi:cytochrome c oxidase subunit II
VGNRAGRIAPWVVLLALAPAGGRARAADGPKRFEVTASRYAYAPARIEVQQGDVVELVLRSADTDHGLAIKAYGVKVPIPKGGATVTASFVASQAGSFPIECSEYCGSGHKRMKGELVVVERAQ